MADLPFSAPERRAPTRSAESQHDLFAALSGEHGPSSTTSSLGGVGTSEMLQQLEDFYCIGEPAMESSAPSNSAMIGNVASGSGARASAPHPSQAVQAAVEAQQSAADAQPLCVAESNHILRAINSARRDRRLLTGVVNILAATQAESHGQASRSAFTPTQLASLVPKLDEETIAVQALLHEIDQILACFPAEWARMSRADSCTQYKV